MTHHIRKGSDIPYGVTQGVARIIPFEKPFSLICKVRVDFCGWISKTYSTISYSWQPFPSVCEWFGNGHVPNSSQWEGMSSEALLEKISPFLGNKSRRGQLLIFWILFLDRGVQDWHLELLQSDSERHLHWKEKRKEWKECRFLKFSFDPLKLQLREIRNILIASNDLSWEFFVSRYKKYPNWYPTVHTCCFQTSVNSSELLKSSEWTLLGPRGNLSYFNGTKWVSKSIPLTFSVLGAH